MNYRSYRWRTSIDRLDAGQKADLAALLMRAEVGAESGQASPGS